MAEIKNKKANLKTDSENQLLKNMDKKLAKETAATKEANRTAMKEAENPKPKNKMKSTAKDLVLVFFAVILGSLGSVSVMVPNGLTFGGVMGIARIVQNYTGGSYSLIYYAFCMVIAGIVWLTLGFGEVRKILLLTLTYPAMMFLLEVKHVVLIQSDDLFLVAVFCGVLFGVSNGLTFKAGYSSGGSDSLAKVIKYRWMPHLSINDINFVLNAIIVLASTFVFGLNIGLYAIIMTYTSMRVGDAVMYGLSDKLVELDIIPSDPDALTNFIMEEMGRGVSSIEITGEYTGDKRKQLKILCSPRESFLIRRYLAHNDPKSFVSVISVKSVWGVGRGFSDIRKVDD